MAKNPQVKTGTELPKHLYKSLLNEARHQNISVRTLIKFYIIRGLYEAAKRKERSYGKLESENPRHDVQSEIDP